MKLDMLPILNGEKSKIDFDLNTVPAEEAVLSELFPDVEFHTPVSVKGNVKNMSGYMVLTVNSDLSFTSDCARCTKPVDSEINLSFEREIAGRDTSKENDDYIFIEDKKLDIFEPLTEQILLEMPSRLLCSEDCKGLCPKCGQNLNEGSCSCDTKKTDPRLEILKTLLK
jgi:uncharacterized protein